MTTVGINYDSATGVVYDITSDSDVTITSNTDGYTNTTWQYIADNGVYNVGNMVNGKNFTVSLTLDPATFPNGVNFSWSFPVQSYWNWVVQAMPNVKYFLHDASGNPTFTQLANLNLTANYTVQISGNTTQTNVAFDMFLYSSPKYGTPVAEVEVMVHSPWTGFGSNEPFAVTVPGLTNAKVNNMAGGYPLIVVSTSTDVLSDSLSLSGVLKTLVSHGLLSAQDYIGYVDFGSEVAGGTGGLDIHSLSYTSSSGATSTGSGATPTTPTISSKSTVIQKPSSTSTVIRKPSSTSTVIQKPSSTSTVIQKPSSTSTVIQKPSLTVIQKPSSTSTVIRKDTNSFGSTSLTEVGNHYYDLDASNGSGPTLKYKGRSVTAGEFGK